MEQEQMREMVEASRVARLATLTPGLEPRIVPVAFALVGDTVYSAIDHKPKRTRELARIRNVIAHPDVSLLCDQYADDWSELWWVRLDGTARIVRNGDEHGVALRALGEKYEQYREQQPEGPVIAIDVRRWRGWAPD